MKRLLAKVAFASNVHCQSVLGSYFFVRAIDDRLVSAPVMVMPSFFLS